MNSFARYFLINFLLVTFFITKFSFGQKPVFGIKLGVAISNSTIDQNTTGTNTSSSINGVGILGGVYLDIPLTKELVFRSGAEIVSKGANGDNRYTFYYYPQRFTYLDIPLNLLYKSNSSHGHLIAGGGPVFGIPLRPGYGYGYALKTDLGLNGLIGYEFPIGFSFNVNYCYGLSNVSKNLDLATKISTRYLGLSVGYSF
jgi:hypothetical protein